ncbi:DNA primase [Salipiger aestuarii]|nr:DNA primase [Salipiger aestuarii]
MVSAQQRDVLESLVAQAGMLTGHGAAPRLLRAAAALVEQAGYEIVRTAETARVTQPILLAAELERLGTAFEKGGDASARRPDRPISGRG